MEFAPAFSEISWAFLFLPHSLSCKCLSDGTLGFFFLSLCFKTNSWNLEPGLGIQLECSEIRGTLSGLEFLDRKFNRN